MFFNYLPLSLIVFLISLGLSTVVFLTSRNDCPPRYHEAFAAGSFIGSICVIYTVAKEVVSVMKAVGIIFDMTDSMVGLSFLAFGNSIGDLVSNIALARQGYQQMAFSACFGGPMFSELSLSMMMIVMGFRFHTAEKIERREREKNFLFFFSDSLLGVGLTFIVKAIKSGMYSAVVSFTFT